MNKKYRKGGFFGNSQAKFADMEGAGQGINMAYKSQGKFPGLGGQGAALRREKRYLKKLERQGKLNEEGPRSADRLDYLKKVQRDRIKKGVGAAALAAGAAAGGAALAAKGGLSGISSIGGKGAIKTGLGNLKTAVGKSKLGTLAKDLKRGFENMPKGKAPELMKKMGVDLDSGAGGERGLLQKGMKVAKALTDDERLDKALQAGLNDPDMQPDEENIDDNLRFDKAGLPLFDISGGNTLMDRIGLGEYGFNGQRQSDRFQPMGIRDLLGTMNLQGRDIPEVPDEYVVEGKNGMKILKGGQKKLDKNGDGKISAEDFKLLKAIKAMYGAKLPR